MAALEDYQWLVSDEAAPWLASVRDEVTDSHGASVALLTKLRKQLSPARAQMVVEQCLLRERAREKFSQAVRMFFTRKGLEQATDEKIAAAKAMRFPLGQEIADLCCGIGGDLLALAHRSKTLAVDIDDRCACLAEANLRALGFDSTRGSLISVEEATQFSDRFDGRLWHIDPDRRHEDHRTTTVESSQPPLESLDRMLAKNPNAAIKLAPATVVPPHWQKDADREWFGSRGECRQQVAWFGALRNGSQRKATIVDARGGPRTIEGSPTEGIPICSGVGRFVYEPHAAVLAAHLVGAVCRTHRLAAVSSGIVYLTAEHQVDEPALEVFEVRDVLPLDLKQVRTYCREHAIGRLEVKKRGIEVDPERLRKMVIATGDETATLIVTRVAEVNRVIVARRLSL